MDSPTSGADPSVPTGTGPRADAAGPAERQSSALVALAKRLGLDERDVPAAIRLITESAARTVDVERASVWTYDAARSRIEALDLFERTPARHSAGAVLMAKDFPAYFTALETERAIAAHDAHGDPRTREFSAPYLAPLRIASMLDAPVRRRGQMIGVLCLEHVGPPRTWTPEEQSFAGSLADFVTLAMESHERREAEAARQALEGRVRHAERLESLGMLAGGIAHDFNNLLVGILGNTTLLLDDARPDAPERGVLEDIATAARRAADLANQMLAYSGRGRLVVQPLDVNAVVAEVAHLLGTGLPRQGRLVLALDAACPTVLGDPTQVRQVVMNLVLNAAESLGPGGGTLTVSTGAREVDRGFLAATYVDESLPAGRYVWLRVADSGMGMDDRTRRRIFDPFFSTKAAGRGLGLATVLGVVRSHRGAIHVESAAGRGSVFEVLLPACDRPAVVAVPPPAVPESWRSTGTVLVVDDERGVRDLATRVLARRGLRVLTAADGREALAVFAAHGAEIGAVLLDLTMPDLPGEAVLARLRRVRPSVRVVLSSGFTEQDAGDVLEGRGPVGFLQKPYTPQALVAKIREALGG